MSEPQRYGFWCVIDQGGMTKDDTGSYVRYEDYARLKAEVDILKDRLRDQVNLYGASQIAFKMYQDNVESGGLNKDRKDAIKRLESENARLKAEVERLTKAGDAMAKAIRWLPQSISDHHLDAWNAAKEGKQS